MERIVEYQTEQARSLLQYAETSIPWYGKRFAEYGVRSSDFATVNDIVRFPTVTKQDIQNHFAEFLPRGFLPSMGAYITTGGSTGQPLGFYEPATTRGVERAFHERHFQRVGCSLGEMSVVLRGGFLGSSRKLFTYSIRENNWHFSVYQMNEDSLPRYLQMLDRIKPKQIQAYPSAALILAKHMLRTGRRLRFTPNALLCGSEGLTNTDREILSQAFGCRVHTWYGHAEKAALAVARPQNDGYDVDPMYGLTELLDNGGKRVQQGGGMGEIVATGFVNTLFPFIRYRTSDLATLSSDSTADAFPFLRFAGIEGRMQELFVTSRGELISMTAINMHDATFDGVRQFQFVQHLPGELVLRIVPHDEMSSQDIDRIERNLRPKIGLETRLSVEIVQQIGTTASGKMRFLEQHLDVSRWLEGKAVAINGTDRRTQ